MVGDLELNFGVEDILKIVMKMSGVGREEEIVVRGRLLYN